MLHFFDHVILQLVCSGSCAGPSDEISPLYSLWATFVGLYIANFVVERSTGCVLIVLRSACFIPNLSLFNTLSEYFLLSTANTSDGLLLTCHQYQKKRSSENI